MHTLCPFQPLSGPGQYNAHLKANQVTNDWNTETIKDPYIPLLLNTVTNHDTLSNRVWTQVNPVRNEWNIETSKNLFSFTNYQGLLDLITIDTNV